MADKLVSKDKLNNLAKVLDNRSKTRDSELQEAIDLRIVQPEEDGVSGQILSISNNGNTEWIDNSELISTEEIDNLLEDVFKDEIEAEGEIIEINKITVITTTQIDDIVGSVF